MHQRPTHVRWVVFALAFAVSWLLYLHRYAWGVVRPSLKKEFDLDDAQLGWLDGVFSATYGLGQVPGGLLGDLCGARGVLSLIVLLWSGCVAALAIAGGFWPLAAVRAAFGLAQAGTYPILSQVTRGWFPSAVRTTVQGAVGTLAGRAGGACASFVVATVLMAWLGLSWQAALVTIAVPGVALAAAFWLCFRDRPREHPWANNAECAMLPQDRPSEDAPAPRLRPSLAAGATLAMLLLYACASTFADQFYVFWVPQLLDDKGMSLAELGVYAMLPLAGGALGGLVGGALNDWLIQRTGSRRVGRAAVALTGKLLAGVLFFASLGVADGRLMMVVLMACKFFGDWSLPAQWGAITDVGGRAAGTVFGAVNTAGSVAAFVAGPVLGYLKLHTGWHGLFAAVAAAYLLAALCWLLIDSTARLWDAD